MGRNEIRRRTLWATAHAVARGLAGTPAWAQAKVSGDVKWAGVIQATSMRTD
jgi:hypothetical protein